VTYLCNQSNHLINFGRGPTRDQFVQNSMSSFREDFKVKMLTDIILYATAKTRYNLVHPEYKVRSELNTIQILELPLPLLFKGLGPSSLPTAVSSTSTVHLSVCPCVCSAVCTLGSITRLYRKMRRIRKRDVFSKKKSLIEKK